MDLSTLKHRIKNISIPTDYQQEYKQALVELGRRNGSKYSINDCLIHVVDFLQNPYPLENLIHRMDTTNIKRAAICGLPVTKMFAEDELDRPFYYLDDESPCYYYSTTDVIVAEQYQKLPPEHQQRLIPLACGFNPVDRYAINHLEQLFKTYPGVFRGVGEILFRHDDLTMMTFGEPPRPNHVAMLPIYEFCAEKNIPIILHQNVTSVGIQQYPKYLPELEEVLRNFPKTRFHFTHCGVSRRIHAPYYAHMIDRLLCEYPLLTVDYSWVFFETMIMPHATPEAEWVSFTEKWSDRVLIGSDNVGDYSKLGVENSKFDIFLDALTPETRERVCRENFQRVYATFPRISIPSNEIPDISLLKEKLGTKSI